MPLDFVGRVYVVTPMTTMTKCGTTNGSNAPQYYTTDACLFVANLAITEGDETITEQVVGFLITYGLYT